MFLDIRSRKVRRAVKKMVIWYLLIVGIVQTALDILKGIVWILQKVTS
jgi:hypothetical protein